MQQLEDEEELAYNAAAADHDVVAGTRINLSTFTDIFCRKITALDQINIAFRVRKLGVSY